MKLDLGVEDLKPLIEAILLEAIPRVVAMTAAMGERMAWQEPEAATLLGLTRWQLRDERLRGRITGSVGPGKRILYTREDLLTYLATHRWQHEDRRALRPAPVTNGVGVDH